MQQGLAISDVAHDFRELSVSSLLQLRAMDSVQGQRSKTQQADGFSRTKSLSQEE